MNILEFNTVLRLRRDNDFNYEKIKDAFIPAKGEACLVDTARNGLRAKIGDGVSTFAQLKFNDEDIAANIIIRGYYSNNVFYYEASYENIIEASINKLYIDAVTSKVYIYDGTNYTNINNTIPAASKDVAGIMKLYDTIGQNTDGTMTQKAISDELNEKVEIELDHDNEMLAFIIN